MCQWKKTLFFPPRFRHQRFMRVAKPRVCLSLSSKGFLSNGVAYKSELLRVDGVYHPRCFASARCLEKFSGCLLNSFEVRFYTEVFLPPLHLTPWSQLVGFSISSIDGGTRVWKEGHAYKEGHLLPSFFFPGAITGGSHLAAGVAGGALPHRAPARAPDPSPRWCSVIDQRIVLSADFGGWNERTLSIPRKWSVFAKSDIATAFDAPDLFLIPSHY